jgi:magnesium chelatase family protein
LHAQAIQLKRVGQLNGHLTGVALERHAALNQPEAALLSQAIANLNISPRGIHKVLKVARTIADLEASAKIKKPHLLEALSYRRLDVLSQESQQI